MFSLKIDGLFILDYTFNILHFNSNPYYIKNYFIFASLSSISQHHCYQSIMLPLELNNY